MKRVILFLATNLAILLVLGVVLSILLPALGLDSQSYSGLLVMCAVFGCQSDDQKDIPSLEGVEIDASFIRFGILQKI